MESTLVEVGNSMVPAMLSESELREKLEVIQTAYKAEKRRVARVSLREKKPEIKVSPKGAVQINNIRLFPVTFYKNEWEQIFELVDELRTFIGDHDAELTSLD